MSRFFIGDTDSSSSDSSDESIGHEYEHESPEARRPFDRFSAINVPAQAIRVVQSSATRRQNELKEALELMCSSGSWLCVQKAFARMNKVLRKMGPTSVPSFYFEAIAGLETRIQAAVETEREGSKKMSASEAKALNWVRHNVKKNALQHTKETEDHSQGCEEDKSRTPQPPASSRAVTETIANLQENDLFATLQQVVSARGKKNTNPEEQVRKLETLLLRASSPYKRLRVLLSLLQALFDTAGGSSSHMSIPLWKRTEQHLNALFAILESHSRFVVIESFVEDNDEATTVLDGRSAVYIQGSLLDLMDRLDNEFTKSLQSIDPNSSEYLDRLETSLFSLIVRSSRYFETLDMTDAICHMSMKRLQHIYFRSDAAILRLESNMDQGQDTSDLINRVCAFLYRNGSALVRAQAILCQAYHHALHDRFAVAKDLLLLSPIQEAIHHADVHIKVLYHRTMAQLGLCAFRQGKFADAQTCLKDISGTGGARELLGHESHIPPHMHLNLELLECTYLTCSMLLEISSSMVSTGQTEARVLKRSAMTPFQRALQYYNRRVFSGPPETTRDHILSAWNALAAWDWQQCSDLIMKAWDRLSDGPEGARSMLHSKIQEEGLRMFLFSNKTHYTSIGLDQLAGMFDLERSAVISIVSKMVWHNEIQARIDLVDGLLTLDHVQPNQVHTLTLALAEHATLLVERNERPRAVRGI
ncbi:translation initiation factor 3 subunit C [Entomortierella parvispora]|uniref:Translation initiation factor 3 subunit C n=1 Tax=Entomortierella parvispora TaxID=205924 RepID=A0A9P3HJH4_9FUNG|nr:translation initiation factor 3 subunit C [Entomortierella parvispora]